MSGPQNPRSKVEASMTDKIRECASFRRSYNGGSYFLQREKNLRKKKLKKKS